MPAMLFWMMLLAMRVPRRRAMTMPGAEARRAAVALDGEAIERRRCRR
jgi:hypothetical protein